METALIIIAVVVALGIIGKLHQEHAIKEALDDPRLDEAKQHMQEK